MVEMMDCLKADLMVGKLDTWKVAPWVVQMVVHLAIE